MNKKCTLAVLAVLVFGLISVAPAKAAVETNEKVPVTWTAWVPCACDGAGEWVILEGYMHILYTVTNDTAGGYHVKMHFQPQGLSGEGLTSGDKYQAVGVTQSHINIKPDVFPYTYTYVNNYRMIGQGKGNNYLVHGTWHITINANGEVTADPVNVKVECK